MNWHAREVHVDDSHAMHEAFVSTEADCPPRRAFRRLRPVALLSLWLFVRAIQSNDQAGLESRVDFPSLRQSLKEQLRVRVPNTAMKNNDRWSDRIARVAPTLIDQLVDAFVTAEGLAALLTDPAVTRRARAENPAALIQAGDRRREIKWSRVHHAFLNGPKSFAVDFDGTKLVFRLSKLRWRLKSIVLAPNE